MIANCKRDMVIDEYPKLSDQISLVFSVCNVCDTLLASHSVLWTS